MGLKIKNIIPVTGDIITPEMLDYIRKYLSPDTELSTSQIKVGTPSIECAYDEVLCSPDILRLCKEAEDEGCDAIFINCYGDPAVRAAREYVNIPVFGGFEPSMFLCMGLADKIGIVTVVEELQQHDRVVEALVRESLEAIRVDGAQAISLGCTAMVGVAEDVRDALKKQGYEIPVIEAAQAAVMLLEVEARMHLLQSRITCMRPPEK